MSVEKKMLVCHLYATDFMRCLRSLSKAIYLRLIVDNSDNLITSSDFCTFSLKISQADLNAKTFESYVKRLSAALSL